MAAAVSVILTLLTATASAQDFVELPPELDARAAHVYDGIMCPICNGQTISQSNSQIASDMRQMVRQRLLAGDTDEEIYDFMAGAFGEDILASPPTRGIGLAIWVIPPVAILAGAIVVAVAVRRLRQRQAIEASGLPEAVPAKEIDPYLHMVDQEMGGNP